MINRVMRCLLSFVICFSASTNASDIFAETFDISVGENHVCALTSLGIKCFGNSGSATLKSPTTGKNPRMLEAGNRFSCMLADEGISCWGEIPNMKQTEILIGKNVVSNPKLLSVGYEHACALSDNNKLKCWGKNEHGETNVPWYLRNITEVSVGMNNTCVIANRKVVCWGLSVSGTTSVPWGLENPRNLTSGQWHHCVQTDRGIKCWGYPYSKFVQPDDSTIKEFTSGGFHNCAIVSEGVKCWDEKGKTNLVEESISAYKLSVGATNACAVTTNKGVICWKLDSGIKGKYKLLKSFVPAGGIEQIEHLSAGPASTCVYGDANNIKCWGTNPDGALDVPSTTLGPISQLSVGAHRTCAIINSTLSCWGDTDKLYDIPAKLDSVSFVSSGGNHICAGTQEIVRCWGENVRGAIDVPKGFTNITQVSAGLTHSCMVANDEISCWGGEGLIKNVNPPKKMTNVRAMCAGGTFSCGVTKLGETQCWGNQILSGPNNEIITITGKMDEVLNIPKEVQRADVQEISCGLGHACAIYNGKIKCWGDGMGLTVPPIKNPRKLSSGWNHACALGDEGLKCWGNMVNVDMPTYSLEKQ